MKEKELITGLSAIEIYKLVLDRKLRRFPMFFWEKPESIESAREIVRYLFEEILKWDRNDIIQKLDMKVFPEYKLGGMLKILFSNSTFDALCNAYPGEYHRWELKKIRVPKEYWNDETALKAMKWLIEEKLHWNDKQIREKYSLKIFEEYNLTGLLDVRFHWSPFNAIDFLYPKRYKPWELRNVPLAYWNEETAKEAIIWLFEEKLKWTDEDIIKKLTRKTLIDNGLKTPLDQIYNDSLYEAINAVYPNRFKKEELYGYIHPRRAENLNKKRGG
ncbi:hypothetical protein [Geosporobacter ferrireducens]|uniref:hypothetical protein n=1 Tax=Geosporobacter ferrireducens TaxID=1424294 RepID=UPI00139B0C10|nr:hypothetical protein [Geosporobacter ferrireducens]MTI53799.1 hypothetical protein [Geosporobacter ferrireducens]